MQDECQMYDDVGDEEITRKCPGGDIYEQVRCLPAFFIKLYSMIIGMKNICVTYT